MKPIQSGSKDAKYLLVAELQKLLVYNPNTGLLMWKIRNSRRCKHGWFPGTISKDKDGYSSYRIKVNGHSYRVSHIIWVLVFGEWPENEIDHKDGDSLNNRFNNLRPATDLQNNFNKEPIGKVGLKGVTKKGNRYEAQISINGVKKYLGLFQSKEMAAFAYKVAAELYQGEYAYHMREEVL